MLRKRRFAHTLWWPTSDLRQVEGGERGVSAAELLGILALYGVIDRDATRDWVRLIPLPCEHQDPVPVWLCATCRTVLPPAERTDSP